MVIDPNKNYYCNNDDNDSYEGVMSDTQKLRKQMQIEYERKLNILKSNINEYYSGLGSEDNRSCDLNKE